MKTLKASWSICGSGEPIEARQISIDVPGHGEFLMGLDNQDRLYLQSATGTMELRPVSDVRVNLTQFPRS